MQRNTNTNENLKGILNYITSRVNEEKDVQKLTASNWSELYNSCQALNDYLDPYFVADEQGNFKNFNVKEKDKLLGLYQKVADATKAIKDNPGKSSFIKDLKATANTIEDFIVKDIRSVSQIKDNNNNLKSIICDAREKVIDVTGQERKILGAVQSQRRVITNNNSKAVFTKDADFDGAQVVQDFKDKYENNYPQYSKFFKTMNKYLNSPQLYNNEIEIGPNGKATFNDVYLENYYGNLYGLLNETNKLNDFKSYRDNDPEFSNLFYQYIQDVRGVISQINFSDKVKSGKNEPIGDRNVGMSVVSELLGCNDLLAHSERATIIDGNNKIQGSTMSFAEGKDINNLPKGDPMYKFQNSNFDTIEAKRQLANIQVIDFICGNMDRHSANMFYQFDENNKCKGIVGIDNDSSFPQLDDDYILNGYNKMVGLKNLNVIDEQMANKIATTSPAMFALSLKGLKIGQKAIDNAVKRYSLLQNMILTPELHVTHDTINNIKDIKVNPKDATLDQCKIHIIKTADWDKLKIIELAGLTQATNSFRVAVSSAQNIKEDLLQTNLEYDNLCKTKTDLATSLCFGAKKELKEQTNKLSSGKHWWRGSSKQYNDIQTHLEALKEAQQTLKHDASKEQIDKYVKLLNAAKEESQAYLDRKQREQDNGKKFGSYTQNRIKVMTEYNQYLTDKMNELDSNYKKKEEAQTKFDEKCVDLGIVVPEEVQPLQQEVSQQRVVNPELQQQIKSELQKDEKKKSVDMSQKKENVVDKQKSDVVKEVNK